MSRFTGRSRLARACASWLTLAVVVVGIAGLGGALAVRFRMQAVERAEAGAVSAGTLIAGTTVVPAMSPKGIDREMLDRSAKVLTAGGIFGVAVWLPDGTPVYQSGPPGPLGPASQEFRAAIRGEFPTARYTAGDPGRTDSIQVLVMIPATPGGPAVLVASVSVPQEAIADLTSWATYQLVGGVVVICILAFISVFALQRRLRQRSHQASHDALTGLGNRFLLESAAGRVLKQGSAGLLIMDLDGFKRVNDNLGHAIGDDLLVHVGQALQTAIRPGDVLVRLGGDEFAALLPDVDEAAAVVIAQRLLGVVQRQFVVRGITVEVDASVGVAVAPPDAATVGELMSAADIAMYRAKRDRLGVCTYRETGPDGDADDIQLLVDLRNAIPANELELHYQPAIAVRPGAGEFVEALVRWHHPERGLVAPYTFIPLAEETALIHPLTEWVIEEAVRQCAEWRMDGLPVSIAVNVSPRSLAHEGLVETVVDALARHQLPGSALHIEVTESAIIARPETAREVLGRLQALGISISIDDFGAGYTSLAHLKRMPVEVLKIDRTFVKDLLTDQPDQAIVSSIIELGHRLGMTVVAEGVEDGETLDRLVQLGCDVVQGYHISRPHPSAQTTQWLRTHDAELDARAS